MPRLTKRVVDTLQPSGASEVFVWDSELRGFGIRLMPTGVGSFILKYRNQEGRQRKLALGRVGSLTPEEARALARRHLSHIASGADPSAERRSIRTAITVGELCDLYVEDATPRIKASTLAMDRSRIEVHIKPLIGARVVTALTSEDIVRLQADILAGKTAKTRSGRGGVARGGKGVASRTVGMLGTILEFARRKKIIEQNPAREVDKLPEGRQTRFMSKVEIGRLGAVLREFDSDNVSPVGTAAIRFLLLSGCRRMEALALPLAWVDEEAHCIRFQDTKAIRAREMGSRVELRPLGSPAVAAIQAVPRNINSPWVFPSARGDGHFVGLPKLLARACAEAQLDGITIHVLRHTFAATASSMGFSELTIAGLLGHRVAGVTARYAHVPDSALLAAADSVATRVEEALG